MIAGIGICIAGLTGVGVADPVLEVGGHGGFTVAVDTATLEEVDHDLVDDVDVAAGF